MMNKQEVIEEIENAIPDFVLNDFQRGKETGLTYALELVEELDEPEKPILTKEEAEWLEGLKEAHSKLPKIQLIYFIVRQGWGYLFEYKEGYEEANHVLKPQLYPDEVYPPDLKERLLNAALYGYEVEKEKLYTVEIPNPNDFVHTILHRTEKGIIISYSTDENYKNIKQNQLTEAEIKQDFEWAWQFAEKVEE